MERFEDPNDTLNSATYHTGKMCIEKGCNNPAGTHWSEFWCQACNALRLSRISRNLEHELARLEGKE